MAGKALNKANLTGLGTEVLADLLIETRIVPETPDTAVDLLWAQVHWAEGLHDRTDDSRGTIGDAMRDVVEAMGRIPSTLAT